MPWTTASFTLAQITRGGDEVGSQIVQLSRRHPGGRGSPHGREHVGHDLPRRLDGVDLGGGLQLDHADNYTGISIGVMVRVPLSPADRERGERLGALLREARGERSLVDVAAEAGISPETLRKIETGRIPTPAFFTVSALAGALALSLDDLVAACSPLPDDVAALRRNDKLVS
jgi:hypothetical protein